MASSKEERRDEEAASTVSSLSSEKQQEEIREAIVNAFDEAKGNTERAVKEAKKEIPRYRESINNYQEKTLEAAREIAENHPKGMIQSYASIVRGYLDSIFAATKLTNNLISANMEGYKASTHHAREFSKIAANNVKTFGDIYSKSLNQLGVRGSSIENQNQKR